MSEEEVQNKMRLAQARREAVQNRLDKADGIKSGMSGEDKYKKREKLYGKEKEGRSSKEYAGKLGKIIAPLAAAKAAKDIVTAPSSFQVMDIPIYGVALILALLKDLLDLVLVGSLPAIGTVITFCISMAIGFVLLFDGVSSSQRKVARKLAKKFLILIAGTMVEGIFFGLNFLPFEALTVGIIYWISLVERKKEVRNRQEYQEEE